jgi:hypothetical protein
MATTSAQGNCIKRVEYRKGVIVIPPQENPSALWFVKQADYATTYKVSINGTTSSIITPESTSDFARAGLDTLKLASDMAAKINTTTGTHGCVATQYGSTVHIQSEDTTDFTLSYSDSLGSTASGIVKGFVEDFKDLPPNAPEGFRVEITGTSDIDVSPYHVIFDDTDGVEITAGRWVETVKDRLPTKLDPATLPVKLERKQDVAYITTDNPMGIYFALGLEAWDARSVGDDDTAPMPTFVSELDENLDIAVPVTIQGMLYHKNRLCFMTRENLVFSEAGEYRNFFPKTVVSVLDADPVDMFVDSNDVAPMEHALSSANEMLLFTPKSQIALRSGEVFNIDTAHSVAASGYAVETTCPPIEVGTNIFFASKGSKYTAVQEYFIQSDTDHYDATNVTEHVPKYIEGLPFKFIESDVGNYIFLYSRNEDGSPPNHLYVHNYQWSGSEKIQSAWQKWVFTGEIIDVAVSEGVLSLVMRYLDVADPDPEDEETSDTYKYYIEEVDLGRDELAEELGHPVYLDQRVEVLDDTDVLLDGQERHSFKWVDPADDVEKLRYFIGYPYTQKYVFSEQYPRGDGGISDTGGVVKLRYLSLNYNDTSFFKLLVDRTGRDVIESRFEGRTIGSIQNILGQVPVDEGSQRYRIQAGTDNVTITIENDSVFDSVFQSATWEARRVKRASRS